MRIELSVAEAVALATAVRPLPPGVRDVRPAASGDAVEVDVEPAGLPGASGLARLAGALAGVVTVTARIASWSDGAATVTLAAQARGIAVDRLLGPFLGTIRQALAAQGLPPDVVVLRTGADGPELVVQVQRAVDERVRGAVVRDVALSAGTLRVEVSVEPDVSLR